VNTDQLKPGFDLARDLRNPDLRARLRELGFNGAAGNDVIVVCGPDEPLSAAYDRNPRDGRRVLAALQDATETCGWWLQWLAADGDRVAR
jgi:hypothetical protein